MPTNSKNLHLTISSTIVIIIALVYGISPNSILPIFFDFKIESTDIKEIFRAIMGLYIAMVALWITGIRKPNLWRTATIVNVFFMFGLASGRVISLLVDGMPSTAFLAGLSLEIIIGLWGVRNLKKH